MSADLASESKCIEQIRAARPGFAERRAQPPRARHLEADGTVDARRLPKAIGSIISNYRGGKVGKIPEDAIPDVLERLGRAAVQLGKMPFQDRDTADVYEQLQAVLEQLERLERIRE